MGLASALSTALTGLNAAETTIDVVGNNVANANTVGFKASKAVFATQYLSTQSLGSSPTDFNGGTNPRQTGLGTKVAEILPDWTQGTIEISSSSSDLAIQGEGFFIVQGEQGEYLYTRNGIFKTNAENQLVTINGERVLGYGVDDNFQIEPTVLKPITIPLGSAAVAQATRNVFFEGTLRPNGDIANQASVIQSSILGDAAIPSPAYGGNVPYAVPSVSTQTTATLLAGGGSLDAGNYTYRVAYIDAHGNASFPSPESVVITANAGDRIEVDLPTVSGGPGEFTGLRIYRSYNGGEYVELGDVPAGTATFVDTFSEADVATNPRHEFIEQTGSRTYNYRITFASSLGSTPPSIPSPLLGQIVVTDNNGVKLTGLPTLDDFPNPPYDMINIYRSLGSDDSDFRLVAQIPPGATETTFIDITPDSVLETRPQISYDGPPPSFSTTRVLDLLRQDGPDTNERIFPEAGVLQFTARKGGRTLATKELVITETTTVQELINFMEQAMGIQRTTADPVNPIPGSINANAAGSYTPGGSLVNGRIQFVGNNGADNSIDIGLSGLQLIGNSGTVYNVNMPFGTVQEAKGESAVADFIAYDSLGIPIQTRVTVVLESRTSTSTTYRWFADSPDNQPGSGARVSVGTGLIEFDGEGNVINVTESTISVQRRNVSSVSPLEFELDFSQLSGLATERSSLAASRQDGSPPGTLSSYIIAEDGVIRGVFSNGVTRDLGQLILARFANNAGLEQRGENLFAAGVNSGLPIMGRPGEQGIGRIIAGARELSNTDIGANLIDLILSSTQYRGNTRVIDTVQRMLDELLNLRR